MQFLFLMIPFLLLYIQKGLYDLPNNKRKKITYNLSFNFYAYIYSHLFQRIIAKGVLTDQTLMF
jgi:hypothetical protein